MSRPLCGKRHYIEAAKGLRTLPRTVRRALALAMADVFARDNEKFDRRRWADAVEKGEVRERPNARPHPL